MNYKIIIAFMLLAFLFVKCKDSGTDSANTLCDKDIIIEDSLYADMPDDEYFLKSVEISGDCLSITIQYGGGCGNVEAELVGSEAIEKSYPPQREIRLSFKDEDTCEALVNKKFTFNLTPARYIGGKSIILKIKNRSEPVTYNY